MAIYHHTTRMIGRSGGRNPTKALAYIAGTQLVDQKTNEIFDFKDKSVEEVKILLPHDAPSWAREVQRLVNENPDFNSRELDDRGIDSQEIDDQKLNNREKGLQLLSDIANSAEKRVDGQVYREIEFSLPRELTYEQNRKLAEEYVQDQFCGLGMLAIQSFHVERCEETGELNPHCHTFFLTRELVEDGLSAKKNRSWNERSLHENWREQWSQYSNFHLRMHGYDITLDHRSYKDQGLDIEPQVKLGKGVKEQERREVRRAKDKRDFGKKPCDQRIDHQDKNPGFRSSQESKSNSKDDLEQEGGFIEKIPVTTRAQELRSVQLRNLYRILRRPEVVLDIVTRHHATFMWGDVQKILGRYVDDVELFQRLDARLKNSQELLLLKTDVENHKGLKGDLKGMDQREEKSIYTTRSMLKAEKSLVEAAESLAATMSHPVPLSSLESGLRRLQDRLNDSGGNLSEDQVGAIWHLVGEGQLKCIVGYAGAGKTTALDACREIWEDAGYRVYGLAPTGRAAQNLEGSGIRSQTLHKFLKSFDEGRCQYNEKSVLVLDEASMVDVERFEGFLRAVQDLGVKAVVVGDGAQLQPVAAGPAFRLVTTRVGVSRLEHVIRQKEDWQRDATVLFGSQESKAAIQAYQDKGHVHLVKEGIVQKPLSQLSPKEKISETSRNDSQGYYRGVVHNYEIASRTSGLIFREMIKEIQESHPKETNLGSLVPRHEDYDAFLHWRNIQKDSAGEILENAEAYKSLLESRGLDPLEMARLFVDKKQVKAHQYEEASLLLKGKCLDHLIGAERFGPTVEVRREAKAALIEDWKGEFVQRNSQKSLLMMAYSNRDVRDLNTQARAHLKELGVLSGKEFTYTIKRDVEDDFGRKKAFKEERPFSKGDRIVFTRNTYGLGVKNGTIGTITELNAQNIKVTIDENKQVSFAPNLNPYFDQGWAITIHKAQGTTVDKSFLLASHEMTQNLTYVAMTRHRENVQVYGSTLDFWREEKVADILSKSGEKLSAADYLDSRSLGKLMKDEDRFLNMLFARLGDELHAMGAVSKQAFKSLVDHFFGHSFARSQEKPILLRPDVVREEARAQEVLKKTTQSENDKFLESENAKKGSLEKKIVTLQDVYEDWKHPAFKEADFHKRVFEEGIKVHGTQDSIQYWTSKREPYMRLFEEKLAKVEKELQSPLLSYMSNESRELARKLALEDPDRILAFLETVKASKQDEQKNFHKESSTPSPSAQNKHLSQADLREGFENYSRFKELKHRLEQSPDHRDIQKELSEVGKKLFKDKEMFAQIERTDPGMGKFIKQQIELKTKEMNIEKQLLLEKQLELDRGGYSL